MASFSRSGHSYVGCGTAWIGDSCRCRSMIAPEIAALKWTFTPENRTQKTCCSFTRPLHSQDRRRRSFAQVWNNYPREAESARIVRACRNATASRSAPYPPPRVLANGVPRRHASDDTMRSRAASPSSVSANRPNWSSP